MKFDKDDIFGLVGTIIFHLIILLILWFTVLKTVIPEEEGGILVNFGNLDMAAGTFEPRYTDEVLPQNTTPTPPTRTEETAEEELVTQDTEESVSLAEKRKKEEERKRKEEEERQRLAEEQRKREEAISNRVANQMANAFNREGTGEPSQGETDKVTGDQGNPFGNSDRGSVSSNLAGRMGSEGLFIPQDKQQEEGNIVVDVTIDSRGKVVAAIIGKGTNIINPDTRREAIQAAFKTGFKASDKPDNIQGTITYKYRYKQP